MIFPAFRDDTESLSLQTNTDTKNPAKRLSGIGERKMINVIEPVLIKIKAAGECRQTV